MRRRSRTPLLLAPVGALTLAACGGVEPGEPAPGTPPADAATEEPGAEEPGAADDTAGGSATVVGTAAQGLTAPWGITFLPDDTAVVTERDTTRVMAVDGDGGDVREIGTVEEAAPDGEGGLLGVVASPDFAEDSLLYLYLTAEEDNRVVRAPFDGETLGATEVVLDGIPKAGIHNGGRLAFGPDGTLYVATGDAGDDDLAPDPTSLAGKILRITPDGDPAPDNPDPDSPVYSLGHRNVQGLAFDDDGRLWASEFGANEADELNLIEAGGDYGWPRVEGEGGAEVDPALIDPQVTWPTDIASPSGLAFVDGTLWMAGLGGDRLFSVPVEADGAGEPQEHLVEEFGRLRDVAEGPDGRLWVLTNNRDGRGDPQDEDDRILLVEP